MPPCALQAPLGPTSSGPWLFSRRPSLSQHPAGSQVVITGLRVMSAGVGNAAAGAAARAGGTAAVTGGTTCAGSGAPERTVRSLTCPPRQACAALLRACCSACGWTLPVSDRSSRIASRFRRADLHSSEWMGSVLCAVAHVAANASRAGTRALIIQVRPEWPWLVLAVSSDTATLQTHLSCTLPSQNHAHPHRQSEPRQARRRHDIFRSRPQRHRREQRE
jgi:hypothetical protein